MLCWRSSQRSLVRHIGNWAISWRFVVIDASDRLVLLYRMRPFAECTNSLGQRAEPISLWRGFAVTVSTPSMRCCIRDRRRLVAVEMRLRLHRCSRWPISRRAAAASALGQGAEAQVFTGLANAAGYPHLLLAADAETVGQAQSARFTARLLHWPALPTDLSIDDRPAVMLFFHGHDGSCRFWHAP